MCCNNGLLIVYIVLVSSIGLERKHPEQLALPRSFIEGKKKVIGKFNALVGFTLSSHEEGIVVLIQQPRLQVAANTRDKITNTLGSASKPESFKELPIP